MAAKKAPKEGNTTLQIPEFPAELKKRVQISARLEDRTLKQLTIDLYTKYLTEKGYSVNL